MNRIAAFVCLSVALILACTAEQKETFGERPVDIVNPYVDTHKSRWFYFSSASRPFGMVNLSPDTWVRGSWNSGYLYDSLYVRCFSHIHAWQLSGIPVMPATGPFRGNKGPEAYKSAFTHETEMVKPGYHRVVLDDYGITAELTSTTRVGFHRYTFPASDSAWVYYDTGTYLGHGPILRSHVTKTGPDEIEGWSLLSPTRRRPKPTRVYFAARFSRPFAEFGVWRDGEVVAGAHDSVEGKNAGAFVRFTTEDGEKVLMKVGISYTGVAGARANIDAELPHWDFDRLADESIREWNSWLSRIEIEGGTREVQVKFYTDLWHALQGRRIISDADGAYCDMTGAEPVIRRVSPKPDGSAGFPHHNFDAWWGSHWSLDILWSMAYPEVTDAFCSTMIDMYRNGGLIPRGPSGGNYSFVMIGDTAAPFFACAYNKGIGNWDAKLAYEGLRKNAFPGGIRDRAGYEHGDNPTGGGMREYVGRGYVPEGLPGNGMHKDGAAMTLEYAYQDWCLGQFAKAIGKDDDHRLFNERAGNYRNIWDGSVGFMRPRMMDGEWLEEFAPIGEGFTTKGFCESNSAIYTNFVPHDMAGLIELFGGSERYVSFLDSSFVKAEGNNFVADHGKHSVSWVDYDNQPGTGMAHLFNYAGAPWLAQKWVRAVKLKAHGDITPYGGYHGDEDQGQMGALGVLMAVGLFEVRGGASVDPVYEITSPMFDRITIHLDSDYYKGSKFTIETKNNAPENIYIQSARLNGKPLDRCWFRHEDFARGGKLVLELGPEPNRSWGSAPEDAPPSMSME